MNKQKNIHTGASRKEVASKTSTRANKTTSKVAAYEGRTSKSGKPVSVVNDPEILAQFKQKTAIEFLYGNPAKNEALFRNLLNLTKLHSKTLAENVFEITPKTFTSYLDESKQLPRYMVEKVIKLQELYFKGIELFGSVGEFNIWMKKESYGLGLRVPMDLIGTITGIEMIWDELTRIEFGATA
jgi:putative toxin-antitoxin system antitoxin component (TIGR02293 family)